MLNKDEYETFARAAFLAGLPCNPVPFRNACDRYVAAGGDPKSDTFKAMAWTVLSIIEGQLAMVDLTNIQGWDDLEDAYRGVKILDLHLEWNRLNEVFNPPKKVSATVRILSGDRRISDFMARAGLGITGAGTASQFVISYKPGEKVDEDRVKKAMDSIIRDLDASNDPLKILSYEILSIDEDE